MIKAKLKALSEHQWISLRSSGALEISGVGYALPCVWVPSGTVS